MGALSYDLEGKVAIVTGGSRGIGFKIAQTLIEQNAKVVICGRKEENLDNAKNVLNAGENLLAVPAHMAKEEDVERLFKETADCFGKLDILINNAGMNIATSLVDTAPSLWQKIIDSNLTGTFLCSKKAGSIMRDQKSGKIVTISSLAAKRAAPAMGIYGIAKAGIEMMTKVLALELAPFNIQVNAVAPSMVKTDFSKPFWSNEKMCKQILKAVPLGKIADPMEVVHPTLFLCSEGASFITGQTIMVDGGSSAV